MTHENLFLKLEAMGISYDSSFWEKILCSTEANSDCWLSKCDQCNMGKNVVPPKPCNSSTKLRQWEKVIIDKNNQLERQDELDQQEIQIPIPENRNQSPQQKQKVSSRLQCNSRQIFVGEVLEIFQVSFPEVCNHVNTKRIQANEFENDKKKPKTRVLQMDFAMAYECEYQNEVQSALWTRGSVNLLTAACTIDGQMQTFLICTDSKHKDKNTILVFVEHLYKNYIMNNADSNDDVKEIIWTDGPSSEFKNKYCVQIIRRLAEKYNKPFTWKYFATSHGKGVVDGVGGNCKSIVQRKTMSKGTDRIIVQNAKDFAEAAAQLVPTTHVTYIPQSVIDEEISTKAPFTHTIPINGIFRMHVILCTSEKVQLWRNSRYASQPADISIDFQTGIDRHGMCQHNANDLSRSSEVHYEVGDWVIVHYVDEYDDNEYPGEVTAVLENEIKVSVLHKSGGYFELHYLHESVVAKIDPPIVVGSRGQFTVSYFNEQLN